MKSRVKKVLSGILAAAMTFTYLPSVPAAAVNREVAQEQLLKEDSAGAEVGEPAIEVLPEQGAGDGKEYLKEIDSQQEIVAVGNQASKLIEKSRQETENTEESLPVTEDIKKGRQQAKDQSEDVGQSIDIEDHNTEDDATAQEQQPLPEQGTVQGTCGEQVSFALNTDTGEVIISGSGPMENYEEANASPFYPYGDIITSVKVSEGVTSIGALAFAFCFGVERVYLPNTLVSIEKQAFLGCVSLQAIAVPDQVTSIGDYALGFSCNNGKNGTYQDTRLTMIAKSGSAAATYAQEKEKKFLATDTLTYSCGENVTWAVDLASGVLEISGQGAMADYTVSSYQGEEPEYYPYRDYITSVVIEDGVTAVGAEVFYNFHNLKQIELADTITAIGQSAFDGCEDLQSILLPASLSTISAAAFSDCRSLKSITLPQGVTEVGAGLFAGCSQLEKIEVAEGNTFFSSYQGALFDQMQESLLVFPNGYKTETFVVPDTVQSVRRSAFSGGNALKSLIFEGDAPSGFQASSQKIEGLTIYYDSSRQNWDSLINTLETAKVTVKDMLPLKELETLTIDAAATQLNVAESIQLAAQISPYLAAEFQWSSSDEAVAVVSSQGKVTAVNPGSTQIEAVSADHKYRANITLTVGGEPFSMPDYDIKSLEEGVNYTAVYTPTKQIVSENLHGIYFLDGKKLGFYSFVTKAYQVVETFAGCDDVYAANDNLYVLYRNTCYIYDLSTQSIRFKFEIGGYETIAIGADAQNRIYISGYSKYHALQPVVVLFSETGEKLSELPVGTSVQAFSGFDNSNGYFYMESTYDYYSWGYSHSGKGLTMGKAEGNRLKYIDTYYSFLESGFITRAMSCLLYLCQDAYMQHQTCAELIGDRYLVAASVLHGAVYVYDSNSASDNGIKQTMKIDRSAIEDEEEGTYSDLTSIGVRTVFNEKNNSIVVYENNKTISEYSLATGEKLSACQTKYKVFNMLKMGDSLIVIEKENDAYYMEILDWSAPTKIQINAERTQMQVGTSQALTLQSDKQYTSFCQWSSSDNSIVSVTKEGKIAAWKEGTAVITAKISESLSTEITITVTAASTLTPRENIVISKGQASENYSTNNYLVHGSVVKSYLTEEDNKNLTRVEYIPNKGVLVETYSLQYKLLESKVIPCELNDFGGYYSGKNANFLVFGQKNQAESDETEVLRIVKYSKNWERQGQVSVKGANTYIPFDAGSLRMTETGNLLYIHTCHEMYAGGDNLHHQANMTFVVNEETMEMEQSYYDVLNIAQAGYVSHSFNQFVQTDGNYVYRVDHGDANPRAISLTKCRVDGKITDISYVLPFPINGMSGDNATGVSVGGFELSSDHCLIAGNSVDQSDKDNYSTRGKRNIFLTVTGKELDFSDTVWLTDYKQESDITVRTPSLVKLSEEQFLVLWEEYHSKSDKVKVKMVTVDAEGKKISEIVETGLRLSDCVPVLTADGLVKWYVTDRQSVIFCAINPYDLSSIKGEIVFQLQGGDSENGTVSGVKLNAKKLSIHKGKSATLQATVTATPGADRTVKWSSSNEKVASVSNGRVVAKKAGQTIITARAGDKKDTCTVTVKVPSSKVSLNTKQIYMVKGKKINVKATVSPSDTTDKITWTSSNKKVAAIKNGKITAKKTGKATVTAKAGKKSASVKVYVVSKPKKSKKVKLNRKSVILKVKKTLNLKATMSPKNSTDMLTWKTSNKKIAKVDQFGKVTAVKKGRAVITVRTSSGKKATCKVTVKK